VYSGSSGCMSTSDLKISIRRGNSPLEGVSAELRSATYFWSPVSQLNSNIINARTVLLTVSIIRSSCTIDEVLLYLCSSFPTVVSPPYGNPHSRNFATARSFGGRKTFGDGWRSLLSTFLVLLLFSF